jgi:hypothetical protein
MSISNRLAITILVSLIIIQIATGVVGSILDETLRAVTFINAFFSIAILIYRIQHEMRITQHSKDAREITFLCFEVFVAAISIYTTVFVVTNAWVTGIQYIIYFCHLTALILLLIFMLTFKIKKLF